MTRTDLEDALDFVRHDAGLPMTAREIEQYIDALEARIRHLERRLAELAHLGMGAGVKAMRAE